MPQLPKIIQENAVGCLCTVDENNNPSGATIFYAVKDEKIYFTTHAKSQKLKNIKTNPSVCFVVADLVDYHQAQLYATARIVSNPGDYIPLLLKVTSEYSEKTHDFIPYMDIKDEGGLVAVELTPRKNIVFKSGEGLVEQNF